MYAAEVEAAAAEAAAAAAELQRNSSTAAGVNDSCQLALSLYRPTGWLETRVAYARLLAHNAPLDTAACLLPETLRLRFPPRSVGTWLEANGARIAPEDEAHFTLRRDKVAAEPSAPGEAVTTSATYIATDLLRVSDAVAFELLVWDWGGVPLVSGFIDRPSDSSGRWTLDCRSCVARPSVSDGWKSQQQSLVQSTGLSRAELCLVGSALDLCTQSQNQLCLSADVSLAPRPRSIKRCPSRSMSMLDVIPEDGEAMKDQSSAPSTMSSMQCTPFDASTDPQKLQLVGLRQSGDGDVYSSKASEFAQRYWTQMPAYARNIASTVSSEDESDQELEASWFGTGLRVGVGMGLGVCLGIGIGLGIMVQTYKATTSTMRSTVRRLTFR